MTLSTLFTEEMAVNICRESVEWSAFFVFSYDIWGSVTIGMQ